ncbi:MAG TPA: DUF5668 domain-containing protein [Bryobacteraceae bacterium]|nr:DUF5668 domain-containing protein [Bryobacteraceae bacterium]
MSANPNIVGYCRACGKPLDEANARQAHGTIYCAEHVPVEPAAVPTAAEASPYTAKVPPAIPHPEVSPGIAFILGLIPGVGAIYNGQYAKGLIHVVIVGLMISILSDNAASGLEPLMGLLLSGFWFYMAFEAYHTAKKRREGLPVDEFSSILPVRGARAQRFPVAPIVLIALGVIFLLDNLDLLDLHRLLRYWPVALIALGAYMLYVRMADSGNG